MTALHAQTGTTGKEQLTEEVTVEKAPLAHWEQSGIFTRHAKPTVGKAS